MLRGQNGEEYDNFDEREKRFNKVDILARERKFNDLKDIKKSQLCCAICVEDFTQSDLIRETQCHHMFHSGCLMLWAKSKLWANFRRIGVPSCPNCNASLIEQQKIARVAPIDIYLPNLESGTDGESVLLQNPPNNNNNWINASISVGGSIQGQLMNNNEVYPLSQRSNQLSDVSPQLINDPD